MSDPTIDCRLVLRHGDFIMQNHRVHGVSVMPGVTFLDIVLRVLAAQGLDPTTVELRGIVFAEAIATVEGNDREIRVVIGEPVDGVRPITGTSRWLHGDEPYGEWRENIRAELHPAGPSAVPDLDAAALVAGAVRTRSMADMYAHTRSREIVHGAAMQCAGPMHLGADHLLAELSLVLPETAEHRAFLLHPAKMDAATIVAYGQREITAAEPFIPMFIDRFRAHGPLHGAFLVHVPQPEELTPSGELFRSTFSLHDQQGRTVAEFDRLTCKRIRRPESIRDLLLETTGVQQPVATAARRPPPRPPPTTGTGCAGGSPGCSTGAPTPSTTGSASTTWVSPPSTCCGSATTSRRSSAPRSTRRCCSNTPR